MLMLCFLKCVFLFHSFERTYDKLMSVERTLEAGGGKKILDCMRSDQGSALLKHNYYNDKFDTTGEDPDLS